MDNCNKNRNICLGLDPAQQYIILTPVFFNCLKQFALVLYDEALQCSDVALANALWYHFFEKKCTDPRLLEALVGYIREQVTIILLFCAYVW